MAGGPKTFGNAQRISTLPPDGYIGAPFVTIIGFREDADEQPEQSPIGWTGVTPVVSVDIGSGLTSAAFCYTLDEIDGSAFVQLRSTGDDIDDAAPISQGPLIALARQTLYNGASWDRQRSASADTIGAASSVGAALQASPGNWSETDAPAAATQATVTRPAGAAGVRHVCTGIDATLILPPGANQPAVQLVLRDGATGAGAILWSRAFGVGAAVVDALQQQVSIAGLNIVGSDAEAMTLEFTAAGVAATLQSVALTGYDAA